MSIIKKVNTTDKINLAMMLLALLLATLYPFKTFLFSFVILGPLHYLTEINWLNDKQYFTSHNKHFKKIAISAAFIFTLPYLIKLDSVKHLLPITYIDQSSNYLQIYTNGISLGIIGLTIGFSLWKKLYSSILLMLLLVFLIFIFQNNTKLATWVGIYIPTIVHVYIFTGIFMLYGALKSKSKIGLINVLIFTLIPFIIKYININPAHYHFSTLIKSIFIDNNFHVLNAKLTELIGESEGHEFFFYELIDLKIQIFIAFAYSYHYLNWFTKTTIIGWHKNFNQKKVVLIGLLWLAAMTLYYIDFKLGFLIVLFFSTLHVFVEFPLNLVSIRGVIKEIFRLN